MSDFTAPSGPPPPKVPEGWKAVWNDQYKEWFYVNIHTKASQWDKPTEPVYPSSEGAPSGPPPGYPGGGDSKPVSDAKKNPYETQHKGVEDDATLAARLQAEENARGGGGTRNAQQDYVNTPMPTGSSYQDLPPREPQKKGFLGKLLGKAGGSSSGNQYPAAGYGQNQYRPPQQAYGAYGPSQQYGGYPPQGYGAPGYGAPGYGGGYGPPGGGYGGGYQQQARPGGGGMGAMGGAALGLGGGLVGGMLLEDAIQDHDQSEYQQGYGQGMDNNNGGDGGGDYGGGDGGGDFGGGDMGGGDF